MPVYEYEGKHFDLPDGLTNEQAIAKIETHLGKTSAPPAVATNPLVEGAGKTARSVGNIVSSVVSPAADFVSGGANLILGGLEALGNAPPGKAGRAPYLSQTIQQGMDAAGLPKPEGTLEKAAYGALEAVGAAGALGPVVPALKIATPAAMAATAAGGAAAEPTYELSKEWTNNEAVSLGLSLLASMGAAGAAGKATGALTGQGAARVTVEDVQNRAKAAYAKVDSAGVALKPQAMQDMVTRIEGELARNNYRAAVHPEVATLLKQLRKDIGQQRVSFSQLEQLRGLAGELKGNSDKKISRLGSILVRQFDDEVANVQQADLMRVPGNTKTNFKEAVDAVQSARKDWAALSKASKLDDLLEIAEIKSNKPSASEGELIRDAFIRLAGDKTKMKQFSTDEQKAIIGVVNGIAGDKTLGFLGRFSPARNQFAGTAQGAGLGASVLSGNLGPAALAAGTAGVTYGADKLQGALRRRQAQDAIQQVLTGRSRVSPEDINALRGLFGGAVTLQDR